MQRHKIFMNHWTLRNIEIKILKYSNIFCKLTDSFSSTLRNDSIYPCCIIVFFPALWELHSLANEHVILLQLIS